MGIKFLGTVEIKENMTTEELDKKYLKLLRIFRMALIKNNKS